jgi:cytochrome c553
MRPPGRTWLVLAAATLAAAGPPPGATTCSGCHGPAETSIPPIAGRPAADMEAKLLAYRAGTRPATVMDRLAKGFSPAELTSIAAWWSAQR